MDIPVYISGEDEVTVEVIKRLLKYCSSDFSVIKSVPARGGQIKSKIGKLNNLSKVKPVILLVDLDAENCAPSLKEKLFNGITKEKNFIFNIAVDEAEAWLLADREGMSSFLNVDLDDIPASHQTKQGGRSLLVEMNISMKSSLVLTHQIALKSKSEEIRLTIGSQDTRCKGKEYNSTIVPFIQNQWNIDNALQNSDSLQRMVKRIKSLL